MQTITWKQFKELIEDSGIYDDDNIKEITIQRTFSSDFPITQVEVDDDGNKSILIM